MREPRSGIPGLVVSQRGASRIAYMPADVDRRYAREHLPDHAVLLANIMRWAAGSDVPLTVEGPGLIDCHLYEQPGRLILHMVNLTSEATWRAPLDELIPVGPFKVKVRIRGRVASPALRLLVSQRSARATVADDYAVFNVDRITDHEVIVIG